jgi:hypothetical protein
MRSGAALRLALVAHACALTAVASTDGSSPSFQQVETTRFDWLGNGSGFEFIVEEGAGAENSESPKQRRLRIVDPSGTEYAFAVPGGIVPIHEGAPDPSSTSDNLIASEYIYLAPSATSAHARAVLIVFGWAYGSDPGGILVLALDRARKPTQVFSSDTFEFEAMVDLDHDGVRELVGRHSLPQVYGGCCTTYDPYSVYRLPMVDGQRARYSRGMSKPYTVSKYGGWSGPRTREDVVVVRCAPGGSKLMAPKSAEELCRE